MGFGRTYGTPLYGQMTWPGSAIPVVPGGDITQVARDWIQLVAADGDAVLPLTHLAVEAKLTETINQASELTLAIMGDGQAAALLDRPYRIEVRNQYDELRDTFIIWQVRLEEDDSGVKVRRVDCQSLISLLARETVDYDYQAPYGDGWTVQDHLDALLLCQENSPPIVRGQIDTVIKNEVRGLYLERGTSVLAALQDLQGQVGGHLWVDGLGRLNWRLERNKSHGLELSRERGNLLRLDIEPDYVDAVTKVYAYGAMVDGKRLTLKDAGEAEEFLEAGGSILAKHGYKKAAPLIFDQIRDADVLLQKATAYLLKQADPEPAYSGDLLDLSYSPAHDFPYHQAVRLGASVVIYDDDITGGQATRYITKIERDLLAPMFPGVSFGELSKDLLDALAEPDTLDQAGDTDLLAQMQVCPDAILSGSINAVQLTLGVEDARIELPEPAVLPFNLRVTLANGRYSADDPATYEEITVSGMVRPARKQANYTLSARGANSTTAKAWTSGCHIHFVTDAVGSEPTPCDVLTEDKLPPMLDDEIPPLMTRLLDRCPDMFLYQAILSTDMSLRVYRKAVELPTAFPCAFNITLPNGEYDADVADTFETITVSAISADGTTLTISERGTDGTTPRAWSADAHLHVARGEGESGPTVCDVLKDEELPPVLTKLLDRCGDGYLFAAIDDAAVTLTVYKPAIAFPTALECPYDLNISLANGEYVADLADTYERVTVTDVARVGNRWQFTVTRGAGGTTAKGWAKDCLVHLAREVGESGPTLCDVLKEDELPAVLTEILDRCPEMFLNGGISAIATSMSVDGSKIKMKTAADCPFNVRLTLANGEYHRDEIDTYEVVTVSNVSGWTLSAATFTLSARGVDGSEAKAWADNCHVHLERPDTDPGPTVCDLVREDALPATTYPYDPGNLPPISIDPPQPVGETADPGSTGELSDAGHVHEGVVQVSELDPEPVGAEADPGSTGEAADAGHIHEGVVTLPDAAEFPAIPEAGRAVFYHTTDLQDWYAHAGQAEWTPMQFSSGLVGTPA